MSQEYILECAKNFENLYSQTNERLQMIQNKDDIKKDLLQIKSMLGELENLLNTIELENSLLNNKSLDSYEYNISQTCRQHFNDI